MAVITPSGRLLFWLRISFLADAVLGIIAGLLIAEDEPAGWFLLAFVVLRAVLGVIGLVLASRMLEERRPGDDRPSVIH
jgi:uncharacterized oligopeptide transporter (OPT) family protein